MKIIVTSSGKGIGAEMDARFGRAKFFIVVDMETGETETVDNSINMNALQGAGIQAAETASKLGAECIITGNLGPKASQALNAAGIKTFQCSGGTVEEAIQKFKNNELTPLDMPNVGGHWQ